MIDSIGRWLSNIFTKAKKTLKKIPVQDESQFEEAAKKLTHGLVCSGGRNAEVTNGLKVQPRSDQWYVIDFEPFNALARLIQGFSGSPSPAREKITLAFQQLAKEKLAEGCGSVAPCFDEFDREVEYARGRWIVVDSRAYMEFQRVVDSVYPKPVVNQGMVGNKWQIEDDGIRQKIMDWVRDSLPILSEKIANESPKGIEFNRIDWSIHPGLSNMGTVSFRIEPSRMDINEFECWLKVSMPVSWSWRGSVQSNQLLTKGACTAELVEKLHDLKPEEILLKIEKNAGNIKKEIDDHNHQPMMARAPLAENTAYRAILQGLQGILTKMSVEIGEAMPETGEFPIIVYLFEAGLSHLNKVEIKLRTFTTCNNPRTRLIEIVCYSPSGLSKSSKVILIGDKSEILNDIQKYPATELLSDLLSLNRLLQDYA